MPRKFADWRDTSKTARRIAKIRSVGDYLHSGQREPNYKKCYNALTRLYRSRFIPEEAAEPSSILHPNFS
jgi:hypothetical protein